MSALIAPPRRSEQATFFKRRTPSTSLRLAKIETQHRTLWDSSALTWISPPAQSLSPTQLSMSEAGWTAIGSSPFIVDTGDPSVNAPAPMIVDTYRTSLEPVWYVEWRVLIEEPPVVSRPPVLPWDFRRRGKILTLHILGSPVLRQRATPVSALDDRVRQLVDDLFETMYDEGGVGLAANQVGIAQRVAVVDVGEGDPPLVLINPHIVQASGVLETAEEGCLSIPDIYGDVERPRSVTLEALDRNGHPYRTDVSGFKARAVQHEIDHLDGVLFLDHLSAVKRSLLLAKWKKSRKGKSGYLKERARDRSGSR